MYKEIKWLRCTDPLIPPCLANSTVLFKTQIVHCLVNDFLDLLPIRTSLDEFVNVLYVLKVSCYKDNVLALGINMTNLRPISPTISCNIFHDLCEIFGVLDDINVS
jgi:hypothetical protein